MQATKRLMGQFFRQRRSPEDLANLSDCCAVTFRPGGHADSFEGRNLQRAGQAVMFTLEYEQGTSPKTGGHGIPVKAYCAVADAVGRVRRVLDEPRLSVDLWQRPRVGARGRVIDPGRNPTLLETALRMDQRCYAVLCSSKRQGRHLMLPKVLLGFPSCCPPAFADTPALRAIAAQKLGIPQHQLGRNGDLLLARLLYDVWEESVIPANAPGNLTGNLLVPAELCPGARGFLNVFEDFSQLVGVPTWNPVRDVEVIMFANPARQVWREAGYERLPDFDEPLPTGLLEQLEERMRTVLAEYAQAFSREDVYDGLTSPDEPLRIWSKLLPELRCRLPHWAHACCTDEDLRAAVYNPSAPLLVRYACRVQVVSRVALHDAFRYGFEPKGVAASRASQTPVMPEGESLAIAG